MLERIGDVGRCAEYAINCSTRRLDWGTAIGRSLLEFANKERSMQTHILHDIFGNPFRPVTINPTWFAWNDDMVRKIAQAIYDERAFDRLPILADALTDAGCDNADILNHCRSEGPHVKGCWVVDLLLDKT